MGERLIKILSLAMIMFSTFIFTYILVISINNTPVDPYNYIIFFVLLILLLDGIILHNISLGKFKQTNNLRILRSSILSTLFAPIVISSLAYLIASIYFPGKWDIIGPTFYVTYSTVFFTCLIFQFYFFFKAFLESRK
jgi:cytochrome c biogenesis factor